MPKRTNALGCWWVLIGLVFTSGQVVQARPQAPVAGATGPAAPSGTETQEKGNTKEGTEQDSADQDSSSSARGLTSLGKDFLQDQKQIWTSPLRLEFSDVDWLVPVSGFAAGLFVTDRDVSTHI